MKKRGAIHIDWVISMSVFILYLLLLLVLIKPGYKASFEGEVLSNIVKDNFVSENRVEINKTILMFNGESSECSCSEQGGDEGRCEGFEGYSAKINELENLNDNNVFVKKLNGGKESFNFDKTSGRVGVRDFDEYEVYYSSYLNVVHEDLGGNSYYCDRIAIIGESIPYIGVRESLGIDNYGNTKGAWNFPEARDFRIEAEIFDGSNWVNKDVNGDFPEPYSDATIYAVEMVDSILGFDESCDSEKKCVKLIPVRILIKVW